MTAGRLATEHLIGLGHLRIAVTAGRPNIVTGENHIRGYLAAHEAHGLAVEPRLVIEGRFDQATAHDATLRLLKEPDPPTAIFALSNMMALGVLNAVQELGLRVPADISVVSIDDFDFANIVSSPTTHRRRRAGGADGSARNRHAACRNPRPVGSDRESGRVRTAADYPSQFPQAHRIIPQNSM